MKSLPLFHRIAGQPVIVLGEGPGALPKRRLVERAGGRVVTDLQRGIDEGARLAFIAHDDHAMCQGDALRLRCAGLLVNVVDTPDLCDFTVPSLLDRDPVLIAVGTSGASAGLAKQLRLRLETLLPTTLGNLATRLSGLREAIRRRWPAARDRRAALDRALSPGGPLDPLDDASADRIEEWLAGVEGRSITGPITLHLASDDPDDLTLRQARLLGTADAIIFDPQIPPAIRNRARADAARFALHHSPDHLEGLVLILLREGSP